MAVSAHANAALVEQPVCSWDNPGANRFTGNIEQAVNGFDEIPLEVRDKLKLKLRTRSGYDDVVEIRRDTIVGKHEYQPELTNMYFGANNLCKSVTRSKWKPTQVERGLVFCEGQYCVVLPTICGNLSIIKRIFPPVKKDTPPPSGGGGGGGGGYQFTLPIIPLTPPLYPVPQEVIPSVPSSSGIVPVLAPLIPQPQPVYFPLYGEGPRGIEIPIYIPVTLPPYPEPPTWILILAGVGVLTVYRYKQIVSST